MKTDLKFIPVVQKWVLALFLSVFLISSFAAFPAMGGNINHFLVQKNDTRTEKNSLSASNDVLQFKADSHIMGFKSNIVYLVNLDHSLSFEFVGAKGVRPVAGGRESGDYTHKNDLADLGRVEYTNIWEGITVIYESARDGIAESTYIVGPNADAGKIRLKYNAKVELQADGSLRYKLPSKRGWMTESRPVAWQDIEGKRVPVNVAFRLGNGHVGFNVGPYDKDHTLVIDPTYQWHTFYGAAGASDYGKAIAIDGGGNIYITGYSSTWLGDGDADALHAHSGGADIVVIKLNSSGEYQWHTFYGSGGDDHGYGIALDGSGNVYVTGYSNASWLGSGNQNPLHVHSGNTDIVVLKLNSSGSYQWHTFYGSGNWEYGKSIAVDGGGNSYITGFSTVSWLGSGGQNPLHVFSGGVDIVVLKLNSSGSYQWHTFYGSAGTSDYGYGIAADSSGSNIYITGESSASWLGDGAADPLRTYTAGAGQQDIFVLKLNSSGVYQWHTFQGSGYSDYGYGIAVDGSGNVLVTGKAGNTWLGDGGEAPLHAYVGSDIVVIKLNSSGAYQWHTFYGAAGGSGDSGYGIAAAANGNVYITGYSGGTWQGDGNADPLHAFSSYDIVVLKLNSSGSYQWHTFYGASEEIGYGIAVNGSGDVYVTGVTFSTWLGNDNQVPKHVYSSSDDIAVLKINDYVTPLLKADYQFQNTLTSSVGSPPSLSNIGGGSNTFISDTVGGAATTVLEFPQHNGLLLSPVSSVILNNTYTIAVIFSFDNTDSYRRIVDFKDSSNDNGLYNYYGKLVFYNNALGVASATISSGAYVQAVITRDSAKNVKGYVNGVQQFAFVDSSDDAAISANDKLKFFRDNTSGSGLNEASSGTVSRIRIYDGALSAADVSALESAAVTYTLDTAKSGLGGGTTLGGGTYNSGSTATLTATADAGSTFTGWSGDCSGTVSPINVVMDGNKTCTANYSLNTYALTAGKSGTGSGTVTSGIAGINCGSDCSESYNYGAAVELFASPAVGSLFADWAGGGCSGTGSCIVNLVADTTVTASFAVKTFTVTPTAPIGGSIGPNTAQSVLYNGTTSFTVVPEAGFSIASVTGCGGTLAGSTYTTGPVTSDCNVTATFKFNYPVPVTYTLTAGRSGTGNGTVLSSIAGINCGEDCTESYSQGQSITLAAKADKDSLFAGWTGCDKVSGAYCTVLLTGNKTVTAKFEQSVPKIEVSITALDFGEVKVGRLRYRSFKVNNTGTGNLVIGAETVGTDAELFKKAPAGKKTIKPNNSATLRVMFRPNSPGEKAATLTITSNDADTPVREIVLTGTGK